MIRTIAGRKVFYAIPSKGRPGNVALMTALTGEATWIVCPEEEEAYRAAGATSILHQRSLVHARNTALNAATEAGVACLQSDDDAKAFRMLGTDGKAHDIGFERFVDVMMKTGELQNAKLVGMAPTNNPFYGKRKVKRDGFIIASIFLADTSDIRFDEQFLTKEDYDFTLQHLARFGAVARCDWLLGEYQHYTNAGGCVADRTGDREQQAATALKAKWPGVVIDHPRRPGEILLKWDAERYRMELRRKR